MMELLRSAQRWISGSRWLRRLTDFFFRGRARRRAAELDTLSVARCQKRILRGLVHQARTTSFGRAHDFRRIRTVHDFQRLVPLSTPAGLWQDYWQTPFPQLAGTTWPGPLAGLAVSARPSATGLNYLPVSPVLLAAHQGALRTALALGTQDCRESDLLAGQLGYVGREGRVSPLADGLAASSWDNLLSRDMGTAFQAARFSLDRPAGENSARNKTETGEEEPITGLVGAAGTLTTFFTQVRQETGRERLVDIWPHLKLVLSTSGTFAIGRPQCRRLIGTEKARVLEAYLPPEGPIAVFDPRHDLLRLLPDHEVFFEFVPLEDLDKSRPVRHEAAEVEPGVAYALALTSPAGVWACLTGTRVGFERRDPPLLRWLEPAREAEGWWAEEESAAQAPSASRNSFGPHPLQPPHPRNGELAAPPGKEVGLSAKDRGDAEAPL
jgi:hypothetical protein